jgi:hypothetical protein
VFSQAPPRGAARAAGSGLDFRAYAAADGNEVRVALSPQYASDPTVAQSYVDFLAGLPHGSELSQLRVYIAPPDEVLSDCGGVPGTLACYTNTDHLMIVPGEQPAQDTGVTVSYVVTHEYGHHVANNRSDAPWTAEDYGTKRWATYEHICSRVSAGTASPGDEGLLYTQNPGEAFAEAYRVLNLTKAGAASFGWDVVDKSFYPDATALSLVEEDVMSPWTGPTVTHVHGTFGYGTQRTIRIGTPLDGSLVLRLHAPTKSSMRLALYAGTKLVGRASRSIVYKVCGARSLTVKVERSSGAGAFTVDIAKP